MLQATLTGRVQVLLIAVLALSGCGRGSDDWLRAAVKGRVTLDGQPLRAGAISFFPIDGTRGPAAGTEIVNGQFALTERDGPVAGRNRVEIRSVQKTGRLVPSPSAVEADGPAEAGRLVEEFADLVPKRYNTYSKLSIEVQADVVNERNFELLSPDQGPGIQTGDSR